MLYVLNRKVRRDAPYDTNESPPILNDRKRSAWKMHNSVYRIRDRSVFVRA